jgi:undecaprenyl-diphosphatase
MIAAFVLFALFVILSVAVFNDLSFVTSLDAWAERTYAPLRTPHWSAFFAGITLLGSIYGISLVSLLLVLVTRWDVRVIALGLVAVLGSALIAQAVKVFTARVRPEALPWRREELEYSYPSGHSAAAFSLYGLIALLISPNPALIVVCTLLILAVGASRLALSVHFASDVIGGYLLAASFLVLAFTLFPAS